MQRYRERYRNEFCQFGRAAGWKGAAGAGQRKAGTGGADSGKGMEWFSAAFAQENEIFLIFRPENSNLVTRMSPKARNEPGWRITGGCVR